MRRLIILRTALSTVPIPAGGIAGKLTYILPILRSNYLLPQWLMTEKEFSENNSGISFFRRYFLLLNIKNSARYEPIATLLVNSGQKTGHYPVKKQIGVSEPVIVSPSPCINLIFKKNKTFFR
jgi:hypothetical protein